MSKELEQFLGRARLKYKYDTFVKDSVGQLREIVEDFMKALFYIDSLVEENKKLKEELRKLKSE